MVRRYEVTDEQWKIIEPHLENKAKRREQKAFFTRWAALSAEQKEILMNLVNPMK